MMKTKFLFAGLIASATFVGCSSDELVETSGSVNAAKGETTLIFDGFGGANTRMAYDEGAFKWQIKDQIGVRRVSGDIVISNTMFEATHVSDDNTTDPSTWRPSGMGDYAFFKSNDETLHEADYIVTYPYDKESIQDGKVVGRLNIAQVANMNNGAAYTNNEYAGEYGFMMSTATHMQGGQNTENFVLYPVFSRLEVGVTESTTLDDVQIQSIILESKDGTAVFPTQLDVDADVQVASNGYLDPSYMTPVEDSKVSQIVLTTTGTVLNATTPVIKYMTVIPGTYENVQIRVNTNKGYFVYQPENALTLATGNRVRTNVNITSLSPYTEYMVASQKDWEQALNNISDYSTNPTIGNTSTIRVLDDVELNETAFRAAAISSKHTINVVGEGSITVTDGLASDATYSLGIMNFNVPVTVKGNFYGVAEGDALTFSELNIEGDFNPKNPTNYTSLTVKKGSVKGQTKYHTAATAAAFTMENVVFGGDVNVTAMTADGNNAEKKTTKVNFKDCTFKTNLVVDGQWNNNNTCVTIDGGQISNDQGTATLSVGYLSGANAYASTVYLKGDVIADVIKMSENQNAAGTLDILGSLTVNNTIVYTHPSSKSIINIQKDATLTLGEDATFNVVSPNAALIEGTLVNNGWLTVSVAEANALTDIDHNNQHLGTIQNNGLLFAPATKWYENQYINLYHGNACENVITGISTVEAFKAAVADPSVTGVQLTAASYVFDKNADFSKYALYIDATTSIKAVNGKFGKVVIPSGKELTLNNGVASSITLGDVTVDGTLTVNATANMATKVTCDNLVVNAGGKLENGAQVSCSSFVNKGTVSGGNPTVR